MQLEELAMAAYTAYGDYLDSLDYGLDLLAWIDLDDEMRGAWMAAASRVAEQVTKAED